MNKINKAGLELIKQFEGFRKESYICPAGVVTIGYGTTGKDITLGLRWSEDQAVNRLNTDIDKFSASLNSLIKVPLSSNEFSAIVCLAYNIGTGAFAKSTLLKLLNSKADKQKIADEFLKWTKAAGRELPGLVKRRQAERSLFLQPDDGLQPNGGLNKDTSLNLKEI